jgi:hypothetical protein
LRDDDGVNKILSGMALQPTTSKKFPKKINNWLTNIEKGLSGNKLPAVHSQISELFADFLEQGVKDYSTYSGYEEGLFKSTKPHNLVLLKKLDETNITFAFIVHYEVHRAVSESGEPQTPMLDNPMVDNLLKDPKIQELLTNSEITTFLQGLDDNAFKILTDEELRALVVKHAEVLKSSDIDKLLASGDRKPPSLEDSSSNDLMLILVAALNGVLLLFIFVILGLLLFRKSQSIVKIEAGTNEKPIEISSDIPDKQIKAIATQVTDMVSGKKFQLSDESKTDLVQKILKELSNEKLSLKEGEIEQIAKG